MAGSAAALTPSCRNRRRGSFMALPASFDHLVGADQERLRDFEAERLGSGQVNDEIVPGGLLDRQVFGLGAAQELVDVVGHAPEQGQKVWSIGHQASSLDISASVVGCWQARRERQRANLASISECQRLAHDEQRISIRCNRGEGGRNIVATSNLRCQYFQPEGNGCGPNDIGFLPVGEIVAVEQDRQPPQIGYDLMQKLEPFAVEIGILARQSGEIAAGCAKLATRPEPTGSPISATMGIVDVASFAI